MINSWTDEQSWNAGSGTYYVLDIGDAELDQENRSAEERVILRESEEIGREIFANYEGQRLQVQGYFSACKFKAILLKLNHTQLKVQWNNIQRILMRNLYLEVVVFK